MFFPSSTLPRIPLQSSSHSVLTNAAIGNFRYSHAFWACYIRQRGLEGHTAVDRELEASHVIFHIVCWISFRGCGIALL
jgi:hypothetical protein